ncbi:MAG: hypothetical protein KAS17_06270, partial [Victivallaceae bacterium]|nr:hypothetical protein [Victivallaceae bacterium]
NGNPLAVFEDHIGNVFFASEFPIVGDFKLIKELEDGEYGVIDSNGYKKIARLKINRYDYFEHDLNNYASWKPTVTHGKSPDIQEQLSELFACYLPGLDLEDEEFLIAEIIEVFDTYSNEINCQIKELKSALALQEVA